ncbi:fibrous sheath-interacting protein 2-like isoform X1 [Arapaima gigas]
MNRKFPAGTSKPFDWPLGRKVPIRPKNPCVLHTTRLCERLFKQKSDFDITDPNGYRLTSLPYNCLHDPNLKTYMNRKDIHSLLIAHGFITEDDKVICSAKEFNRYKDYLADVQLDWDQKFKMEQKKIVRAFLVLQDQGKIPADTTIADLIERLLQKDSIFIQQQGAPRGRVSSSLWRENDYLVLKLPKIKKINNLCSSFYEDHMVWKVKERKMLEEVVKEVQRELRLERQGKVDELMKDKQRQELQNLILASQEEKLKSLLEAKRKMKCSLTDARNDAIKLFNQPLTNIGSMVSTTLQRRPSLQKLRPLVKTVFTTPEDMTIVWAQISPTSSHQQYYKHQLDEIVEKLVDEILSYYFSLSLSDIK